MPRPGTEIFCLACIVLNNRKVTRLGIEPRPSGKIPDALTVMNVPYFLSLFLFPFASNLSDSVVTLSLFTLLSSDYLMPPLLPCGFYT